jgi:hypothetical protein
MHGSTPSWLRRVYRLTTASVWKRVAPTAQALPPPQRGHRNPRATGHQLGMHLTHRGSTADAYVTLRLGVTAGTLFQDTRKPLTIAIFDGRGLSRSEAFWWLARLGHGCINCGARWSDPVVYLFQLRSVRKLQAVFPPGATGCGHGSYDLLRRRDLVCFRYQGRLSWRRTARMPPSCCLSSGSHSF